VFRGLSFGFVGAAGVRCRAVLHIGGPADCRKGRSSSVESVGLCGGDSSACGPGGVVPCCVGDVWGKGWRGWAGLPGLPGLPEPVILLMRGGDAECGDARGGGDAAGP
jgi:hypothetical protein